MNVFILTPRAEQDIGDIWEYIAVDNIEAAGRVTAALESAIANSQPIRPQRRLQRRRVLHPSLRRPPHGRERRAPWRQALRSRRRLRRHVRLVRSTQVKTP